MRKIVSLLAFLPLMLLLTGCPYNSKIPLSKIPKIPIDKTLLGTWQTVNEKDSMNMTILEFNSMEYFIDVRPTSNKSNEVSRYRAYSSKVGDYKIMNIEDLSRKKEYNFFRYILEGDFIKIQMVSDVVVKEGYDTPKSMTKAFVKKSGEKGFFEEDIKFIRKK